MEQETADKIKLRILKCSDYPGLSDGPSIITRVRIRGSGGKSQRKRVLTTEAGVRVR